MLNDLLKESYPHISNQFIMRIFLCIPLILLSLQAFSQEIARFTVFADDADRLDCPVGIYLDQVSYNLDSGALSLLEIVGEDDVAVPCQLEPGHSARLWFLLSGDTPAGTSRSFILQLNDQQSSTAPLQLQKRQNQLRISLGSMAAVHLLTV